MANRIIVSDKTVDSSNPLPVVMSSPASRLVATSNFTGTGNGDGAKFAGKFNASVWGTFAATVILERSFDNITYLPLSTDVFGNANSYSAPMTIVLYEPEAGVYYRFRCSAFTSGTINWRLSQ